MTWFLTTSGATEPKYIWSRSQIGVVPALFAVLQVQRDEIAVGRFEVQPVSIDADAAIADVDAAFRLPGEVPDFAPGARIHGPDVIGQR